MIKEDVCKMDCEFKKVLESPDENMDFYTLALSQCALCIHSEKKNCFSPREEEVIPTSIWGKLWKVFKEHCVRGSG